MPPVRLDPWQNIVNVGWGDPGPTNPPDQEPDFRSHSWAKHESSFTFDEPLLLTVDLPVLVDENNLLLATMSTFSGSVDELPQPPDGSWTELFTDTDNSLAVPTHVAAWRKIAGPSEPSSYDFTIAEGGGGSVRTGIVAINNFRGVDTADPVDVLALDKILADGSDIIAPDITTSRDKTLVLVPVHFNSFPWFPDQTMNYQHGWNGGGEWTVAADLISHPSAGPLTGLTYDENNSQGVCWIASIAIQAPLTFPP